MIFFHASCMRENCILVKNTFSHYLNVSIVVPKESVLGPVLFLIYVNSIQRAASNVATHLFADDSYVFLFDKECISL